jgi:outer membrane biosynthesis protein TonB
MDASLRTIVILFACLVASSARAEDGSTSAARKSADAAASQGGGDEGSGRAGSTQMIVDDEPQGAEVPPPAPTGDERRVIGEYIRNHTPEIRDCYEKRLRERKTLQGKLIARFDIGPNGRVIGASTEGMADRELSLCVLKVIRGWEFDKPRSSVKLRVAYPWVFTPRPSR